MTKKEMTVEEKLIEILREMYPYIEENGDLSTDFSTLIDWHDTEKRKWVLGCVPEEKTKEPFKEREDFLRWERSLEAFEYEVFNTCREHMLKNIKEGK